MINLTLDFNNVQADHITRTLDKFKAQYCRSFQERRYTSAAAAKRRIGSVLSNDRAGHASRWKERNARFLQGIGL